jgi:hypothetical protein
VLAGLEGFAVKLFVIIVSIGIVAANVLLAQSDTQPALEAIDRILEVGQTKWSGRKV